MRMWQGSLRRRRRFEKGVRFEEERHWGAVGGAMIEKARVVGNHSSNMHVERKARKERELGTKRTKSNTKRRSNNKSVYFRPDF